MPTRRKFLQSGLGALGWGLAAKSGLATSPAIPTPPLFLGQSPILSVPASPQSVLVDGLPFAPWFFGDDFVDPQSIPFHVSFSGSLPAPSEEVDVAIVGGGISGLTTAYLLRRHDPVLFELRPRYGGNALGERWRGTSYSLGSAYVIEPDPGTFPYRLYRRLGLSHLKRRSFPPDPMEVGGVFREDYWTGAGFGPAEAQAFRRYAEVVTGVSETEYPEIPLSPDPVLAEAGRELDRSDFRTNLELRMGMPLTPFLAAGIQAYFYSSFGVGMEQISAASGWNFVAAEEYGRWVFPGGNAGLAWALWRELRGGAASRPPSAPSLHRTNARVVDVRRVGSRVHVTWVDETSAVRTLRARHVVMAGSKHVCKYVLHDLPALDPPKYAAMQQLETSAYLVANVLLDAPIERDFYDLFLIGDTTFPMTSGAFESASRPVDVLTGHYARDANLPRGVLTFFWPLPYPAARFSLLLNDPWQHYASLFVPRLHAALATLNVPASSVRQIRMARWGHAMPIAAPGLIADGVTDELRRPFQDLIHFANQDNWALPAIENSLADAETVADLIDAEL